MAQKCNVPCNDGKLCDPNTGECVNTSFLHCKEGGCLLGAKCDKKSGLCVPSSHHPLHPMGFVDCNYQPCGLGGECNTVTGQCEGGSSPEHPVFTPNCNDKPCGLGGKCNTVTGKCESTGGTPIRNICKNQHDFNRAFYKAVKYTNHRNDKNLSCVVAVYLVIHFMFLIWGIMLAFQSQPPNNRVVHITLAIVFGPAYVLAYYLNMF